MLYLSEAVALPVRMARPPPAETTRCVDCQITDHFTFAPGEGEVGACPAVGEPVSLCRGRARRGTHSTRENKKRKPASSVTNLPAMAEMERFELSKGF